MFSIIICSRRGDIPSELRRNLDDTVGCEYELVIIDNSADKYSIFQAYNEGASRAKGEIICFMHEDVLFRSSGWGKTIEQHFSEDGQVGMIGFAGAHFLPEAPLYWYGSPFISQRNLNNDNGIVEEHFHEDWFGGKNLIEVVAVDGFCFFVRRDLFQRISFDEKTYKGFHLYDMDICMQVIDAGYKVCVCRDVLAEHCWSEKAQFSKKGSDLFANNLILFVNKWKEKLPIWKGLDLPQEMFLRISEVYRQSFLIKRSHRFCELKSMASKVWKRIRRMCSSLVDKSNK